VVPDALKRLIKACLTKSPNARPTPRELLATIERLDLSPDWGFFEEVSQPTTARANDPLSTGYEHVPSAASFRDAAGDRETVDIEPSIRSISARRRSVSQHDDGGAADDGPRRREGLLSRFLAGLLRLWAYILSAPNTRGALVPLDSDAVGQRSEMWEFVEAQVDRAYARLGPPPGIDPPSPGEPIR
jgi:hypothetical protein